MFSVCPKYRLIGAVSIGIALMAFAPLLHPKALGQEHHTAAEPIRIGFVDIEVLLDRSKAIQGGLDRVEAEFGERAREIRRMEREYEQSKLEFDRQRSVLAESERARKREELRQLEDNLNRLRYDFDRDAMQRERSLDPLLTEIIAIIADVAERENFDLVIRGETVLYGRPRANLTAEVLEEIDKREQDIYRLLDIETVAEDMATTQSVLRERIMPEPRDSGESSLLPLIP